VRDSDHVAMSQRGLLKGSYDRCRWLFRRMVVASSPCVPGHGSSIQGSIGAVFDARREAPAQRRARNVER
jgi:hypothetical protein